MWYISFGFLAALSLVISNKEVLKYENIKYLAGIIILPLIAYPLWRIKEKKISEKNQIVSLCLWFGITLSGLCSYSILWNFLFGGFTNGSGLSIEFMALVWAAGVSASIILMKIDRRNPLARDLSINDRHNKSKMQPNFRMNIN